MCIFITCPKDKIPTFIKVTTRSCIELEWIPILFSRRGTPVGLWVQERSDTEIMGARITRVDNQFQLSESEIDVKMDSLFSSVSCSMKEKSCTGSSMSCTGSSMIVGKPVYNQWIDVDRRVF